MQVTKFFVYCTAFIFKGCFFYIQIKKLKRKIQFVLTQPVCKLPKTSFNVLYVTEPRENHFKNREFQI